MNRIAVCMFGVLTALGATHAPSAEYPTKSIRMAEFGYDPTFIGPPGSQDYVFAEMRKWRKVMQESAMKVN